MRWNRLYAGLLVLAVIGWSGCGKVPEEVKQATDQARSDAMSVEADKYAPEAFAKAQATYEQATAEEDAQNQKFALIRNYNKETELLNQSKAEFEQAKQDAAAGKERTRTEAEQMVSEARAALDSAEATLAKAPMSKDTRADVEAMKSDVVSYRQALTDAETAMNTGDYISAKSKAEAVKTKAAEIEADVQGAIAKVRGGR
jgi:hypothetical protein